MAFKNKSNRSWIHNHINDPYVQKAQKEGYRSRAAYKLLEINERDPILKPHMTILELGSAPGGWSQVLSRMIHPQNGLVVAIDILPMEPVPNVHFIQADFLEEETIQKILTLLKNRKIDLILSDMSPNLSGVPTADQAKIMYLAELALDFALNYSHEGSDLLLKTFQGDGFDAMIKLMKLNFKKVVVRKPESSRAKSSEMYVLARGLKKNAQ